MPVRRQEANEVRLLPAPLSKGGAETRNALGAQRQPQTTRAPVVAPALLMTCVTIERPPTQGPGRRCRLSPITSPPTTVDGGRQRAGGGATAWVL